MFSNSFKKTDSVDADGAAAAAADKVDFYLWCVPFIYHCWGIVISTCSWNVKNHEFFLAEETISPPSKVEDVCECRFFGVILQWLDNG